MRIIFSEEDKREIRKRAATLNLAPITDEDFKNYSIHKDLYKNYTTLAQEIHRTKR